MPAAYTDIDEANARIDQLEAEVASLAEAGRQVQKKLRRAEDEIRELKMSQQIDTSFHPGTVRTASPAGGL